MNKKRLIGEGYRLFSAFARPARFHEHFASDPEAADHESLLQARNRQTLALDDVAGIGYNPISGISPEGMAYFMPRLVELALDLESISRSEQEPYLWCFVLQISPEKAPKQFALFEDQHCRFLCKILQAIWEEHEELIREGCFEVEFQNTLEFWCKKSC